MFESNILIKGKHATYLKFLCDKTKNLGNDYAKNGAGIFKRYVDVLLVAPVFGVLKNRMADEDKSTDEKSNIFAEQISKEKANIQLIYNLVNLVDTSRSLTPDEKISSVFRKEGDMNLFMSYVRGGIEYLFDHFSTGASTKSDYYEKIVELVNAIQFESEDNYEEQLKKLN